MTKKGKHYFTATAIDDDIIVFFDNYLTKQLKLIRCWHDNQTKVLIYTPFSFTVWREIKNIEEKSFQSIELEKYVTTNNCPTRQGRFYYFIHLSVLWTLWVIIFTFLWWIRRSMVSKSMNSELSWKTLCLYLGE